MEILCVSGVYRDISDETWKAMDPRTFTNTVAGKAAADKLVKKLGGTGVYKDLRIHVVRVKDIREQVPVAAAA